MTSKEIESQVKHWNKKKHQLRIELDKVETIINDLQELCPHQYDDGVSAVMEDAHASPYSFQVCRICGKVF